jgi:hypothetical protein
MVQIEWTLRNSGAALHPGGAWDLGDPGSFVFADLTLKIVPRSAVSAILWSEQPSGETRAASSQRGSIYQDSSGGERWDSPNHVDANSEATVSFRGYRVTEEGRVVSAGERATPIVRAVTEDGWLAASVSGFWQNFPKALRWVDGCVEVALFPGECRAPFELQGGEQKRHTVWLEFGDPAVEPSIADRHQPPAVHADPGSMAQSDALPWFTAAAPEDDPIYAAYVQQIIEGPHAFVRKREIIDEFGWRNFGELYADHEAVHHTGPRPFVSHYNNQYDFVYGAGLHFARSGDARWRELLDDAARHLIDIDIYHTTSDKAGFSGGLFWHTDHHQPAATSTHRTYSRKNGGSGYGGGPSNEHNYTSGLLLYYYLTGDPEAAAAVRELADWVLGMDDGARTLFALIDDGPTGDASRTREDSYHGPGRGAGNSITALLDAYSLTGQRRYLTKAEELIQRCVHPADDIESRQLDEPEQRWSYLVFLQVLGRYLEKKRELGELDYWFQYAKESLLHYAGWMLQHEVPYQDVLHKVDLPTETWPAHDVRKAHILFLAASYSCGPSRATFRERASWFFTRCLSDLTRFPTAHLTRPLVLLAVYGTVHDYFRRTGSGAVSDASHAYDFGAPAAFVPQQKRLKAAVTRKLRAFRAEAWRLAKDKASDARRRIGRDRRAGRSAPPA